MEIYDRRSLLAVESLVQYLGSLGDWQMETWLEVIGDTIFTDLTVTILKPVVFLLFALRE